MAHQALRPTCFSTSLFCQRLKELSDCNIRLQNLRTATESLVSQSEAISGQIVRHLPQFTLHDRTHLWNVLGFMEELAGGSERISNLAAGDCAMAVWAVFIHDLGMVLEAGDLAALDAVDQYDSCLEGYGEQSNFNDARAQEWRAYRDGHEHWTAIRKDPHSQVSRMRLGIIRAAFIRDTHARHDTHTSNCRIQDWLRAISLSDPTIVKAIEDFGLDERIVRVGVSHNQDITWLPRQLKSLGVINPDAEENGDLGTLHWTWIGWLLRLSDVFDCDASRTPRILFENSGITDNRSQTEWKKHLSIPSPPSWSAGLDGLALQFDCPNCPGPVVEKAIQVIVGWMNEEIGKCRTAWLALPKEIRETLVLHLPSTATVNIIKRKDDYLYQDIEFRLDREAVIELLMGESLYGGPELALRELVQNALDAVHLRDQRNKLAVALESAGSSERLRFPNEFWGATKGGVEVTWGTESDGRNWIEVRDNGVGMTIGAMKRFLTQVGKSYYKSDDFRAEQELMRRHGILCTAISQFGIGFLSVFMLADEVEIRTRPVVSNDIPDRLQPNWQETQRFPFRAMIHGPHGMIAFYPDRTIRSSGTSVKLWLKEPFVLSDWDKSSLTVKLRSEFYGDGRSLAISRISRLATASLKEKDIRIDPGFEIGRFIVWPLYPVNVGVGDEVITLDETFHLRELLSFDSRLLYEKAREWGEEIPEALQCGWERCEWIDSHESARGVEGTGSRIRIVAPQPNSNLNISRSPCEWASLPDQLESGKLRSCLPVFTEAQLPEFKLRIQCLVNGVRILPGFAASEDLRDCNLPLVLKQMPQWTGPGSCIWIDLRGSAMPRLRADRSAPVRTQSPDWELNSLMQRWLNAWPSMLPRWLSTVIINRALRDRHASSSEVCRLGYFNIGPLACVTHFLMDVAASSSLLDLPGDLRSLMARDSARATNLEKVHSRRHSLFKRAAVSMEYRSHFKTFGDLLIRISRVSTFVQEGERGVTGNLLERFVRNSFREWDLLSEGFAKELDFLPGPPTFDINNRRRCFKFFIITSSLSEALWPDINSSLPVLGWSSRRIPIDQFGLSGPICARTRDKLIVPDWLRDYDLVAPFTAFALPSLRSSFPMWMESRIHRMVYLVPFLLGEEPRDWRLALSLLKPFDKLLLFIPNPIHLESSFEDLSPEEWGIGSASAFWDLETGQVFFGDGIQTADALQERGLRLRDWLELGQPE